MLKVNRQSNSNRVQVVWLRAAVVLFRVINIQDPLLPRRHETQQWQCSLQLDLNTRRQPVSIPDIETTVVIDLY